MKRLLLTLSVFLAMTASAAEEEVKGAGKEEAKESKEKEGEEEKKEDKEEKKEEKEEKKEKKEEKKEEKEEFLVDFRTRKWTGSWRGRRDWLRAYGIEIEAEVVFDDTWNLHGGKRRTPFYGAPAVTYSLSSLFDFDKMGWICGGSFFFKFMGHHGKQPTKEYIGAFVTVNDLEAPPYDQIYDFWYKQTIGDELWVLVGKSDAYENFTRADQADLFLNDAYTDMPSIFHFPAYPNPAMSLIGSVTSSNLTFTMAVFDGSEAHGFSTGRAGIFGHFFNHLSHHAFLIGEVDWRWEICNSCWPGHIDVGVWRHTARFDKFAGGHKRGVDGFYLVFEQFRVLGKYGILDKKVGLLLEFGVTDPTVSPIHYSWIIAATLQGISAWRPYDSLGIGMERVDFTRVHEADFTEPYEASFEIFYTWQLTGWAWIKPDFQYIVHPGGMGLPNASVISLRCAIEF